MWKAIVVVLTLVTGCGGATVGYGPRYHDLAYVAPGVHAVVGNQVPMYYADNYYWRYDGGYWYRSPYYDSGWNYVQRPPAAIARLERPWSYYYRQAGQVRIDRDRYNRDRLRSDRFRPDRPYRPRPRT